MGKKEGIIFGSVCILLKAPTPGVPAGLVVPVPPVVRVGVLLLGEAEPLLVPAPPLLLPLPVQLLSLQPLSLAGSFGVCFGILEKFIVNIYHSKAQSTVSYLDLHLMVFRLVDFHPLLKALVAAVVKSVGLLYLHLLLSCSPNLQSSAIKLALSA